MLRYMYIIYFVYTVVQTVPTTVCLCVAPVSASSFTPGTKRIVIIRSDRKYTWFRIDVMNYNRRTDIYRVGSFAYLFIMN